MSKVYLKVKIKSLAEEAYIIRNEENKAKKQYRWASNNQGHEEIYRTAHEIFWGLRNHRTINVRNESRATQLAYAYIRGKKYSEVENNSNVLHKYDADNFLFDAEFLMKIVPRVVKMVNKYGYATNGGNVVTEETIINWIYDTRKII